MRCFVAFDLPRPVRNHLAKITSPLRDRYDIRWVPPEQLHLTVLFAGALEQYGVDALAAAVESYDPSPISLSLQPLGVFPPFAVFAVCEVSPIGRSRSPSAAHGLDPHKSHVCGVHSTALLAYRWVAYGTALPRFRDTP